SLTISAVLIFCFIFWLVGRSCSNKFTYRFTGIELGLCLFGIAAIVAGFAASDKRMVINNVTMFFAPALMAVLLAQILDSPSRIKLVLAVIAALGIVSAYQCTEQFFISNQMMIEQYEQNPQSLLEPLGIEPGTFQQFLFEHRLYTQGVRGFFTTRNSAGSFALMASFAAIALFIDKFKSRNEEKPHVRVPARRGPKCGAKYLAPPSGRDYSNLACGTAVAIVIFGLALTCSKGAILGSLFAAALLITYLYFGQWLKVHKKAILIVCLLLIIAGSWLVISYGLKHNRLPGGSGMLVRWQYWHASAKMYTDHPLTGVGPGNFTHFYPHYKPAEALESVADPHNFLIGILTQYGPLGLVGFLAMIFIPLSAVIFPAHPPNQKIEDRKSKIENHRPLAIIFLITISAALLLIRPMIMSVAPADTMDAIIYVILALYVAPVAVFFIGFMLLTAPLQTMRDTRYEIRDTRIAAALFCAVLGVLLHNLIDFAIFEPGVLTTFWAIIACLIAIDCKRRARPQLVLKSALFARAATVAVSSVTIGVYICFAWWPVYKSTSKIQQAHQALSLGQPWQAHDFLTAAAEYDWLDPTALNLNGRLYLQHYSETGEKQLTLLKKAEECFLQAIERNKADYKNYEKLSTVYDMLGQPQEAYNWCFKATELYPGSGRLRFKLAKIAEQLGKTNIAIEQYRKAIKIEDSYRRQFQIMYPERKEIVSRLGEEKYQFAIKRVKELSEKTGI
ncbi:MAG: O-antigen ligase family protein, partial [Phycisphaerae bacterium]